MNQITREETLLNAIADGIPSNTEPITREEMYLSYIAGETSSRPVSPITRKEILLEKIATNGISGGGSSINVQPLYVSENGKYTAPSGIAYSPVNVQVKAESGGGSSGGSRENRLAMLVSGTLKEVTANDLEGATEIRKYAFYQDGNLQSIMIPKSVTVIRSNAFQYCTNLETVTFEEGCELREIETAAFSRCGKILSIVLPNTLDSIGNNSFQYCNLSSLDFPSALDDLNQSSLSYNTLLKTIILRRASVVPLENTNVFVSTPFASGGTGGTCYVPQALIESYKTATNWSALYEAGTCNFVAIEGSEYE